MGSSEAVLKKRCVSVGCWDFVLMKLDDKVNVKRWSKKKWIKKWVVKKSGVFQLECRDFLNFVGLF